VRRIRLLQFCSMNSPYLSWQMQWSAPEFRLHWWITWSVTLSNIWNLQLIYSLLFHSTPHNKNPGSPLLKSNW